MTDETCAACNGSGWIDDPETRTARRCPCRDSEAVIRGRLLAAGMGEREVGLAFAPWRRTPYSPAICAALEELESLDWLDPVYVLWGVPGCGKTSAAARTAAAWIRGRRGSLAWCCIQEDLDRAVAARFDRENDKDHLEQRWLEAGLLILDGLGEEEDRENRLHILEVAIVGRERRGRPTIITANGNPATLCDGRLVSRFRAGRVVEVSGPDFRGLRR